MGLPEIQPVSFNATSEDTCTRKQVFQTIFGLKSPLASVSMLSMLNKFQKPVQTDIKGFSLRWAMIGWLVLILPNMWQRQVRRASP